MTYEEKCGKLQQLQSLTEWLGKLKKKHECALIFDRHGKAESYAELIELCEESVGDLRKKVEKAIDELEKTDKTLAMILEMRYLYGLSADDVGEVLGLSGRWVFCRTRDGVEALRL